jgi:hypothetical protein
MESERIIQTLADIKDRLQEEDGISIFEVVEQPFPGFVFEDTSAAEFVEKGLDLDATEFYLIESRTEEDDLKQAGICFFYDGRPHTLQLTPDQDEESIGEARGTGIGSASRFGLEESEEEQERKEEVADQLLTEYNEYLDEEDEFEIKNRLERMRLGRLKRIQNRAEEQAKIDPEREKELARAVYERDEFNQQFNKTDTEMLLDQIDVEFDPEKVRIEEVHTRAKSLLKIN